MSWKNALRLYAKKLTGLTVYQNPPHGLDLFHDIRVNLPNTPIGYIFDVGANVGESALEFAENFPKAMIYCFEPVSSTYDQLFSATRGNRRINVFMVGMGQEPSRRIMKIEGMDGKMATMLAPGQPLPPSPLPDLVSVSVDSIDNFCEREHIQRINFLKIDTEGRDLEVLHGATRMFHSQNIDIIQVEAGMSLNNLHHVNFDLFSDFMETRNYRLFGLYEQRVEWLTAAPNLRRVNPVFISRRVIEQNTGVS